MADIRRVRIERLVLTGVPPGERAALLVSLERNLSAALTGTVAIDPAAPRAAHVTTLNPGQQTSGGTLGASAASAIARAVTGQGSKGGGG